MSSSTQPPTPPAAPPAKAWINTRSAHNVKFWIRQNTKEGRLRRCFNLDIDEVHATREENGVMVDDGSSFFIPVCRERSFESNFAHTTDAVQLDILQHSLQTDPLSCPKNCTCFKNRTWGTLQSATLKFLDTFYAGAVTLLKGFAALTWQTQVAIIGLLVLVISPKWAPLIISVARAVWGRSP